MEKKITKKENELRANSSLIEINLERTVEKE